MAAKIVLFVFAQVLVQSISAQCAGRYGAWNAPLSPERLAADVYATERYTADKLAPYTGSYGFNQIGYGFEGPFNYASNAASYGGPLPVASSSPIPPNGVSLLSENAIEGPLAVSGQLPFLGTVALEGALPTAGAGTVNFGAGNGNVAMLNEEGYGAGFGGYGAGFGGYGAGFGSGAFAPGFGYGAAAEIGYEAGLRRGCGCGRY